ncbi:DUF6268 family outer membrane beta-barrel protein [Formosa sp. PL04]|uniref:DUF6268 family outer membrane beta-barrel protein n=1 Tax=Formosa sp. PL04 TaxID=3081755 RepID=UPI002981D6A6|nr:DUF6268 family outer membrane beta-barrel protein [Formosa sp. PL04]MDW5288237.1 DUF6268 family outer membrane beta-barrel protein [Formosa sp. PL04]
MKKILILLLVIGAKMTYAQEVDGVYLKGEMFPGTDVTDITKLEAGINILLINTSKEKLTVGGKFQNTNFIYVDSDVPFETDEIEDFNTFSFKLAYQRRLSDTWSINVMGESQVSSNFGQNDISSEDLFFNARATFEKYDETNNAIWTLGAAYDIQYGLYYPIPVFAYTKRLDDAWAYKIGFPDARVKWSLSDHHNFEGFATLTGFTGNINDGVEIYKEDYYGTLRQTSYLLGLGYNYNFLQNFEASVNGGYSMYNSLKIQDYSNNTVYDFDASNSFYLNVGVKYKFKDNSTIKSLY